MYFSICNDVSIRNYRLKGNKSILIRILEPSFKKDGVPYKIGNITEYKDVLELYIEDTIIGYEKVNKENVFNSETAKILNEFILKNDFDEVVVHCSLGISRSPAIMICIAKILNNHKLEDLIKESYTFYNSYIVEIFEKTNYSIKEEKDSKIIEGNVLYRKNNSEVEQTLIKIIK